MFSGWLLTNQSGNHVGTHQKFNRVARRRLDELMSANSSFPNVKTILHFEGRNGPDGAKTKSPAQDEPWHYYDPFDPTETGLLELIDDHRQQLVAALKENNQERAGYEAAWLAHALTDGLTPAHHYPYEAELEKLRGEDKSTRTSFKDKTFIKGDTTLQTVSKNWSFWGPKGLFTTHWWFEWGVSAIVKPLRLAKTARPTDYDLKTINHIGFEEYYKRVAREIALLDMYDRFYKRGWTPTLAKDVRTKLAPTICRVITAAWYDAVLQAEAES